MNKKLKERVIHGYTPICLHIPERDLINSLCDIIRAMEEELIDLRSYKDEHENADIPEDDNQI